VDSDELRQVIDRLQQEVAALEAAERDGEAGVAALSAQLSEDEGRLTLTQRALADYRQRLADTSAELEQAITDEARQAFENMMARREQTAAAVAEAANLFLERQDDFERLSEEAREAWATWAAHDPNVARDRKAAIDARPEILDEAAGAGP